MAPHLTTVDNAEGTDRGDSKGAVSSEASTKCAQCKRKARVGCIHGLCSKCCVDDDSCEVHRLARVQAAFRQQVMDGTTPLQQQAAAIRSKRLFTRGAGGSTNHRNQRLVFREPGFGYLGDTVVIWSLREYLLDPKRKEDALRKSSKRRARTTIENGSQKPVASRKRRFRQLVEDRYQESLLLSSQQQQDS